MSNQDLSVRIDGVQGESFALYLNGELVGRCVVGRLTDQAGLEQKVRRADVLMGLAVRLRSLRRGLGNLTALAGGGLRAAEAKRIQACARGLLDGLALATQPHPAEPTQRVPPLPDYGGEDYRGAYDLGASLAALDERVGKLLPEGWEPDWS